MITALALVATLGLAAPQAPAPQAAGAAAPAATAATSASPGDSLLDAQTRDLAAQLRCPVCQGLSLQDSPSELAQEMRSVIRDQLRAGRTPSQVRDYFISKYGEWILLKPEPHGFNLAVYLLPILGLLAGGTVIALAARRWTGAPAPSDADPPEPVVSRDHS
jgi:cytochrome c-type biogenesis protein CcmH